MTATQKSRCGSKQCHITFASPTSPTPLTSHSANLTPLQRTLKRRWGTVQMNAAFRKAPLTGAGEGKHLSGAVELQRRHYAKTGGGGGGAGGWRNERSTLHPSSSSPLAPLRKASGAVCVEPEPPPPLYFLGEKVHFFWKTLTSASAQ